MYNRHSPDTIIVIIVFFERLAQPTRILDSTPRFLLQHPFKHTVGENFPGGIWEARRKRELSCQGNTALRGFPGQRQQQPVGISRRISEKRRRGILHKEYSSQMFQKRFCNVQRKVTSIIIIFKKLRSQTLTIKKNYKICYFLEKDKFKSERFQGKIQKNLEDLKG